MEKRFISKKEMRTLPMHPFCKCVYANYYGEVKKGKRKSFKEAAKETLEKFSEYEQREILGSREKLMRFKAGEDIEKIFNSLRPKYPIRKYVELFGKMSEKIEGTSLDIKLMLDEIKNKKKLTKNKVIVGKLSKDVIKFLEDKNIPIYTKEIYINHKGLSHLTRNTKKKRGAGLNEEDILRIPEIIASPSAVFFEKSKQKFNLLYCDDKNKKCIKLVINTKFQKKKEKLTLITTAGYINSSDMKNPDFELIFGDWKF